MILSAIPKKTDKVGLQSMRYISLLPVLQKFYIRALQSAVRRERKPHETHILGFEPGRSTAGITATLRQIVGKAAEWGIGAFVASADVESAFDCIKHMDVQRALLQKVFILHRYVLCSENLAISRVELTYQEPQCRLPFRMLVVLDKVVLKDQTCGIKFWTSHSENLLLDGNLRRFGFKLAADYCRLRKRRRRAHPAEDMNGTEEPVLHHLCWADDLYAMAGSIEHLIRNLTDMTNAVEDLDMRWKEKSLKIVAGPYTDFRPGQKIEIVSKRGRKYIWHVTEGMKALGTWLDSRGCSETSMWHRISKGNSLFYAKKGLFCDPKNSCLQAHLSVLLNLRAYCAPWVR